MSAINLASKYSSHVDERFQRESQASLALNNNYEFTGVDTVNVFSIPVVPMTDYNRSGSNRYGDPNDLSRNVQSMKVTKDRSFTFVIDKGNKLQSQMVMEAGKALNRQIKEVWVPEFDSYVFKTMSKAAIKSGNYDTTVADENNAYSLFLKGMEVLGDNNVPDKGRVCFCSYKYANLLKQDDAFMKSGDNSQEMIIKGVIGEVDGCKIVKVPSSRLPAGAAFILTHPSATTAPKQLEEFKVHENPPGISGWLVEGRTIYDAFVLNEKVDAVYYCGGQGSTKRLTVGTSATGVGKTTMYITTGLSEDTNERYYKLVATPENITYGAAIGGNWIKIDAGADKVEITPDGNKMVVQVIETTADGKIVATGHAMINVGK